MARMVLWGEAQRQTLTWLQAMGGVLDGVTVDVERERSGLLVHLGEDQVDVGRLFGLRSRRDVDKWAETGHVEMAADEAGPAPALARCAARLLCRTTGRLEAGDHEIFVGEVVVSEVVAGGPALPMRGRDWIP